MNTPFIFGKLAVGDDFTNRTHEIRQLRNNFLSGTNTIIISPRRWGKSSLVEKAAKELNEEKEDVKVIFLDLFNVRTEEAFFRKFAEAVLKGTSTKAEDLLASVRDFLRRCTPRISFSPDQHQEFSLGFDWSGAEKDPDEILELPQKIAASKGWKLIVCIDEFQNIGQYSDPEGLQRQLRSIWQRQPDVSYCLYGSKRSMMIQVFNSPSMPFYKFGDIIFLDKISPSDWQKFLVHRFQSSGKSISPELAGDLAARVDHHPYYVQQLAQLCWLRAGHEVLPEMLDEALDALILQLSLLFQGMTERLNGSQLGFLEAVIRGETRLSSMEVIGKFNLGTSANVNRVKNALIEREIIDIADGHVQFLDPLYRLWLERYCFRVG